jgi:hypothetical protein
MFVGPQVPGRAGASAGATKTAYGDYLGALATLRLGMSGVPREEPAETGSPGCSKVSPPAIL